MYKDNWRTVELGKDQTVVASIDTNEGKVKGFLYSLLWTSTKVVVAKSSWLFMISLEDFWRRLSEVAAAYSKLIEALT